MTRRRRSARRRRHERRALDLEWTQQLTDAAEVLGREARRDAAEVAQLALAGVRAEQQRAEPRPSFEGVGETADDELGLLHALQLQPVRAAPARVARRAPLAHDPLQVEPAYLFEQLRTLALEVMNVTYRTAIADDSAGREEALQQPLAGDELDAGQVVAVEMEQVERRGHEPSRAPRGECLLQQAEAAGTVGLQRHQLAVEQRTLEAEPGQRLLESRQARGPIPSVPADEADLVAVHASEQPIAVELDLVKPSLAVRRRVDPGRELRREGLGQLRPARVRYRSDVRCG